MPSPRHIALCCVLLAGTTAHADPSARLEAAWDLLDAGRNAEAERQFAALLDSARAGPAAARGLAEALRRDCRLRDGLARFELDQPGLAEFTDGLRTREARDFATAEAAFRSAAAACRAAGDPLSVAAALLAASDCAMQDGRWAETADQVGEIQALLPELAPAAAIRIGLEARTRLAGSFYLSGRMDAADSLYALVATKAAATGRTSTVSAAVNGQGSTASRRRRVDDSRRHYLAAIELARVLDDRSRLAIYLLNLAYDQTQARDFDGARRSLAEARKIVVDCGYEHMIGRLHTGFGALAEGEGDRDGAVRHFRDAYRAFAAAGDGGGEMGARQWLAYNLMMSGHYGEATEHYTRALEIIEERNSPQVLNWVLAGLALSNHRLGHLEQAEIFYLRAMAVNEGLGDHMSVAWCRHALGSLEVLRGNYREARVHNQAALELCRDLDDVEGMGEARVALADIDFRLGNWDRAVTEYEAAVDLAREHDLQELLQGAVTGLAAVCTAADFPQRARAYCEEGLAIARRWDDRNALIWALIELAELAGAAGDCAGAREHLDEAADRLWPRGPYLLRSRTRLLQARCAEDPDRGLELAHEALALAEAGGLPEREWISLTELGALRLAAGDTAGALADQQRAIEVIESLRRNVGSEELLRHMLRPALLPYERLVDLLAADGSEDGAQRAFAAAERSRARILAGRLRAALAGGDSMTVTAEERDVLASIGFCQTQLQDPELPDDQRTTLRQRVAELETEYLMQRLRAAPATAQPAIYAMVPPEPAALLAIPRTEEQVVTWFLGSARSWLFHLRAGRVVAHPLPPRARVETLVRRFLALRESPAATPRQITSAGRRVHDLLLGPVLAAPAAPQTLVVIPDGLLHRLPFAALPTGDGLLVDRYEVFTAPSLQSLDYLRRREDRRRAERGAPALAMVAVASGGPGEEPRLHPYHGRPFAPLQHADEEARSVAELFAGSLVLIGGQASESALANAPLDRTGILHLAAHSDADYREVRRSFVLLGRSEIADGSDGLLQWREAAALDLGTSLVTLASCRSARGVLAVGEGVTGLTQAFLFAGGTCVLAAQTDVSDAFTRGFMLDFYRHLRDGETAAGALRQVQLAAASRETDGRARWADFVLVGDGTVTLGALRPATTGRWRLAALLAGVLAAVAVSVVLRRRRT